MGIGSTSTIAGRVTTTRSITGLLTGWTRVTLAAARRSTTGKFDRSKPVAITVILASCSTPSFNTTPKLIWTSSFSAAARIRLQASLTSCKLKCCDAVMLIKIPLAPRTPPSSRRSQLIAFLAASITAFSPLAVAVPIMAYPMPCMMARMSEKSRLIKPGVVMMSAMPCTACRKTSSAV